jgi:hypothetical protein
LRFYAEYGDEARLTALLERGIINMVYHTPDEAERVVMESDHPYITLETITAREDNTDDMKPLELPGHESMLVWFDPQTKTKADRDYLTFWHDEGKAAHYGEEKYSGGHDGSSHNWPTIDNPLHIPAGKCTVGFVSDGYINDWGWRLTAASASEHAKQRTSTAVNAAVDLAKEKGHTAWVALLEEAMKKVRRDSDCIHQQHL